MVEEAVYRPLENGNAILRFWVTILYFVLCCILDLHVVLDVGQAQIALDPHGLGHYLSVKIAGKHHAGTVLL